MRRARLQTRTTEPGEDHQSGLVIVVAGQAILAAVLQTIEGATPASPAFAHLNVKGSPIR
jgi:hypothetical protein